jgi:PKD repeat protein
MIKNIKYRLMIPAAVLGTLLIINSCEYKYIADAPYPDQLIYMPAAIYNPFTIDAVPVRRGDTPTPGMVSRFTTDTVSRQFKVHLGVYRSGVTNEGSFDVNVAVNSDTISDLITAGTVLPAGTRLMTSEDYTIVSSVNVPDGADVTPFDLIVNLDTLRNIYPNGKLSLGITISSEARKTNPSYATTLVLIDTKFMKPTAGFTSAADAVNPKLITFTNTSLNGMDFTWDFGDGSAVSKEKAPKYTYAAAGTYTVKLKVIGVTDHADKAEFTANVTVL